MLAALLIPALTLNANAQAMTKKTTQTKLAALTEDQKILHLLNRLGYGVRPGDAEKVKQIGVKKYIEQQLNPTTEGDSAVLPKIEKFDVLNMSNDELFAKYPNQGAVLQAVARRNGLNRRDLQGIRRNQIADAPKNAEQMMNGQPHELCSKLSY